MNNIDYKMIAKYGLILLAIAVVCTLLLALTNMITEPVIAERQIEETNEAQSKVLPEAKEFQEVDNIDEIKEDVDTDAEIIKAVDLGYDGQDLKGYVVTTLPKGYGGEIELLTGISTEGEITGISILDQSETAGLGARSTEAEFQDQFKGLSSEENVDVVKNQPAKGNEIEAISGATITSKAVATGVNTSREAVDATEEINEEH